MKFFRCAFCVLLFALGQLRAQQDVDESVDDFKPTVDDDMILYTQKFSFRLGFRDISGAKSSFSGKGVISSVSQIGAESEMGTVQARYYHDGSVYFDSRTSIDPSGRTVAITPDGKTNNWRYSSDSQAVYNGLIMMNTYSASVTDTDREKNPKGNLGVDLSIEREMGKLFGSKIKWGLIGGMSINGLSASTSSLVTAKITTVTDYYSLFGQTAPTAPFSGTTTVGTVDATVLLGSTPLPGRTTTTTTSDTSVTNVARLKGAYLTFRAGPTLFVPITEKFSGTFSFGLALAYTGTTYELSQTFVPETGDSIIKVLRDGQSNLLPGFYADASMQYAVNDTAGFYLGAIYQSTGSFDQSIGDGTADTKYTTHVDLSSLQGFRAGVSFKF